MTSERLKELQKLQNEVELGEIQPDPPAKEVNLGAGSYRVRDANEGSEEEKKKLLRKIAVDQDRQRNRIEPWKIYTVVAITIISCLLLLWALFSGATPDKYINTPSSYKPLTFSQLKSEHEAGGRESYCPDGDWIPDECLDERRRKSMSTMDMCQEIFSELEYTEDYLVDCGLMTNGG